VCGATARACCRSSVLGIAVWAGILHFRLARRRASLSEKSHISSPEVTVHDRAEGGFKKAQ
jgi:hypothetical protein